MGGKKMDQFIKRLTLIFGVAVVFFSSHVTLAKTETSQDEHGLMTWKTQQDDLVLTIAQRKPSQTEAFFLARQLPENMVKEIANACTLQLIVSYSTKTAQDPITLDLAQWQVLHANKTGSLKTREGWLSQWKPQLTATQSASFNWSLFPTDQTFYPQDMNMGMIMVNLAQGSSFDLRLHWLEGSAKKHYAMKNLSCPKE